MHKPVGVTGRLETGGNRNETEAAVARLMNDRARDLGMANSTVANASGWAMNLPTISRDDPEQQKRHSMELLRDAPMDMGLGIKREDPHHY